MLGVEAYDLSVLRGISSLRRASLALEAAVDEEESREIMSDTFYVLGWTRMLV